MPIVLFKRPDGKSIAVNASAWQTVTESADGIKGANTQIGFTGGGSAIFVRDSFDDVIRKLEQLEK
jgi:hypothetical protein